MDIHEQRQGAVIVLKPIGPLVGDNAKAMRARVQEVFRESLGRCVIDASSITYVDSAGLETLLDLTEQLSESGHALKMSGVTDTVREVLELTELAAQFEHFEDVQTAVRSFL